MGTGAYLISGGANGAILLMLLASAMFYVGIMSDFLSEAGELLIVNLFNSFVRLIQGIQKVVDFIIALEISCDKALKYLGFMIGTIGVILMLGGLPFITALTLATSVSNLMKITAFLIGLRGVLKDDIPELRC